MGMKLPLVSFWSQARLGDGPLHTEPLWGVPTPSMLEKQGADDAAARKAPMYIFNGDYMRGYEGRIKH
jgi:hypothetical protein